MYVFVLNRFKTCKIYAENVAREAVDTIFFKTFLAAKRYVNRAAVLSRTLEPLCLLRIVVFNRTRVIGDKVDLVPVSTWFWY